METLATPNAPPLQRADDEWFRDWRLRELSRIDDMRLCYLDYTGAGLYPAALIRADAARLEHAVRGNPHSANRASLDATRDLGNARSAILDFLRADPDEYRVIFTPNASGACRLVGESYPFGPGRPYLLSADNHNSVNGIREYALARGATVTTIPLDAELRMPGAAEALRQHKPAGLFAYPAQSNFSGVRHSLGLVDEAHRLGYHVLLDTAAYLPTSDLDLSAVKPDFLVLSLYKIIGYPTGVGALVARREALAMLRRPWFAGGTVDWVMTEPHRHRLRDSAEAFEDGTPAFLTLGAVPEAISAAMAADRHRLARHLRALTARLLDGLAALRHANGQAMVRVHGPADTRDRGATVALSVMDAHGAVLPCWDLEVAACEAGFAIRSGCFCNPGCAEMAFGLTPARTEPCLDALGDAFTIPRFAECLGTAEVGAARISMGLGSVASDVDQVLQFLAGLPGFTG